MPDTAKLTVTSGPDRGKSFELSEDLMHIGREAGCQIQLTDPELEEHQASICNRNGRFAIYTPLASGIEVDGNAVPPEQWVWLPEEAYIRICRRTALQFEIGRNPAEALRSSKAAAAGKGSAAAGTGAKASGSGAGSGTATKSAPNPAKPAKTPISTKETDSLRDIPRPKRPSPKAAAEKKPVARFITDGPGDPLVKLGDDGHLPELRLEDGQIRKDRSGEAKQTSPLIILGVVGLSLGMTMLMLFFDSGGGAAPQSKEAALRDVALYYGEEQEALKPYQVCLREARQARSRGDFRTERQQYRRVLDLLRAEGNERTYSGVTGNKNGRSDKQLEQILSVLMQ